MSSRRVSWSQEHPVPQLSNNQSFRHFTTSVSYLFSRYVPLFTSFHAAPTRNHTRGLTLRVLRLQNISKQIKRGSVCEYNGVLFVFQADMSEVFLSVVGVGDTLWVKCRLDHRCYSKTSSSCLMSYRDEQRHRRYERSAISGTHPFH